MTLQSQLCAICDGGPNPRRRFEALQTELAAIGAKARIVAQTHDDVHFEIECPTGRTAEAAAILTKHFPDMLDPT